ncbi:hypothetical protein [Mariniflexile sp.]|uniref:hypothetical protein n=1 Tax=Mariniflexile sp. TaxID=1979402 RepID=UPI0035640DA1
MTILKGKKISLFLFLIGFFTLSYFLLQWWAKNYVEDFLSQKLPSELELKHADLNINILFGNVTLHDAIIKIKSTDSLKHHTFLELKSLDLRSLKYSDLLFNETLSLSKIVLKEPKIRFYPDRKSKPNKQKAKPKKKGIKDIEFNELNIVNGGITIFDAKTDRIKSSAESLNLKVSEIKIDLKPNVNKPFSFKAYDLKARNVILGNSNYETFKISQLNLNKDTWKLENLQIVPKYSKTALSQHLKKERDHIILNIPKVFLNNVDFNFFENRFGIVITSAEIINPKLKVYRDKLLPDDLTVKPLYSKSLRNLDINLAIKKTEIKNGYISYAELVEKDKNAGELFFNQVDATINQISNHKNADTTEINIHSKLMGTAPLELQWRFDVNNTTDAFEVSGSINNLQANLLNPFFKPNLNALAEGTLQQMFFTFYGNTLEAKGEMKMKYEDFEFKILRQNSFKINKVLTTIGNLFISDGSKTDPEGFRHGAIEAERDATKSFFNYLWINIKNGVISTLTGNGNQKK